MSRPASAPEVLLLIHLLGARLPSPETEVQLIEGRGFRFDFVWREHMLIAEVEGGMRAPGGGRHRQREGFERDATKYNAAAVLGYRLVRFTPAMINSGEALRTLEQMLPKRPKPGPAVEPPKGESTTA